QGGNPAQRRGQLTQHLCAAALHRRLHQLVPASEVVIELALTRPGRRQHLIQAGPLNAALSDQLRGALHDPLTAGTPAPRSRLTRHAAMLALHWTGQSRKGCGPEVRHTAPAPPVNPAAAAQSRATNDDQATTRPEAVTHSQPGVSQNWGIRLRTRSSRRR